MREPGGGRLAAATGRPLLPPTRALLDGAQQECALVLTPKQSHHAVARERLQADVDVGAMGLPLSGRDA